MKLKIFNAFVTMLAVIGFFVFIGAVGNMDYMVEIGQDYPLIDTLRTIILGVLLILPAVVREVK